VNDDARAESLHGGVSEFFKATGAEGCSSVAIASQSVLFPT
jgi:hypothetical protein